MRNVAITNRPNRRKGGIAKLELFFLSIIVVASILAWRTSTLVSNHDAGPVSIKLHEFSGGNIVDAAFPRYFSGVNISNASSFPESKPTTIATTQQQNETKPYFILHVGPPKTATTYLQCNLHELAKDLAEEDSYFFLGKVCPFHKQPTMENNETDIPGKFLIMGLNEGTTTNRGADLLMKRLEYHRARGNHVIYSNEAFAIRLGNSNATWACLQRMLEGWNVRVVVTYRHYFDWIRSFYYQRNKAEKKKQPPYVGFLDYHLQVKEAAGESSVQDEGNPAMWGHHMSVTVAKKFAAHFEDVQYQNLHDNTMEQDLLTDFVCRILPNAYHTCRKLRTGVTTPRTNRSDQFARIAESFNGYRIVEAAFDKGWFSKTKDRKDFIKHKKQLSEAVHQHIQEIGPSSLLQDYWECPSPTLVARLLNVSNRFENELFELSHGKPMTSLEQETAKKHQFNLYQTNQAADKYCDLDPELILKNETWVSFLKELNDKIINKNDSKGK